MCSTYANLTKSSEKSEKKVTQKIPLWKAQLLGRREKNFEKILKNKKF